jgi:ribosomal protein L29
MAEKVKIGQMSVNDLKNMVQDLKNELRTHRFNKVIGQAANTTRSRIVKRRIATGLTVLREYELGIRKPREAREKKDK